MADQVALAPHIEVIDLGTNDAKHMISPGGGLVVAQPLSAIEGRFAEFSREFPSQTCVVFVTVNTHNPSWNPQGAQMINDFIRRTATHVVSWDAAWSPTYFDDADDPHPNEAGRQALIALIDSTIATCGT